MDTLHDHQPRAQAEILQYLERLPGYPYDPELDRLYVEELLLDYGHVDVLDQIKAFRWYHDGNPAQNNTHLRLAIRRWLANARS